MLNGREVALSPGQAGDETEGRKLLAGRHCGPLMWLERAYEGAGRECVRDLV